MSWSIYFKINSTHISLGEPLYEFLISDLVLHMKGYSYPQHFFWPQDVLFANSIVLCIVTYRPNNVSL